MIGTGNLSGFAGIVTQNIPPVRTDIGDAGYFSIVISQKHGFFQSKFQKRKRMNLLIQGDQACIAYNLPSLGKYLFDQLIKDHLRSVKR